MDPKLIQDVVTEVMLRLKPAAGSISSSSQLGVYSSIDPAVEAANASQQKLVRLPLKDRDGIVKLIKQLAVQNAEGWGRIELAETKIGRLDHKIEKLQTMAGVPGVEFLETHAHSGGMGVTLDEFAPFGVIGCIAPVTHSIPTITCNAINMIASGNALVVNPHPSGASCAAMAVDVYNRAIRDRFGIDQLITCVNPPTLETAEQLFHHRNVHLICVTGGPAVARAALKASKRSVVAGPGNPPVVVDETACLTNAAKSIVRGAAYDNNLLCIGEKQIFVVESVADRLIAELVQAGSHLLSRDQVDALTRVAFPIDPKDGKPHLAKELVGQDPSRLAAAAGASVGAGVQLLIGETGNDHPFVQQEQMMPFVPIVRCRDAEHAMDLAIASEHGYRHTAIIHSNRLDRITRFGRMAQTTLLVVNGPSVASLGNGGEGYGSYSIATPTGEGITTPLTFTRFRRIAIAGGSLRTI